MHEALLNKPTSSFPLSIGTSLSLESLFDPVQDRYDEAREIVRLPDLSTYNLYVFNISTILRNLISSIKYIDLVTVPRKDIYDNLLEEIDFITTLFGNNNLNVKFYVNTYQYVKNAYDKENKLRKSTTDKQHYIDNLTEYCLDKIRKEDDVDVFSKDIHYNKGDSVLLFTHIPFDLLSYNNFIKLDLLESNTGTIKSRKDWWTKYYPVPGKDMSFLPFMEYLLSIFGDKTLFTPASIKERNDLWEAMKKKNVNPLTSEFSFSFLSTN